MSAAGKFGERTLPGDVLPGARYSARDRARFGAGDTCSVQCTGESTVDIVPPVGNRFGAASDDYHFYVLYDRWQRHEWSASVQDGNDDPLEDINVTCAESSDQFCFFTFEIKLFAGGRPSFSNFLLRDCELLEFGLPLRRVVGHQARPGGS